MTKFAKRTLAGLEVSALGIGSSYGVSGDDVERAFERGVNFFFWGSRRRAGFGDGVRRLARTRRDEMVIAVQSYTRVGFLMGWSVRRALRALGTDYVDVLGLAWWNAPPPRRILDAARRLRDEGKVKRIMISCHDRPTFGAIVDDPTYDAIMVRYNAAHPGAEKDVFPHFARRRPGSLAFTATRWGTLLDPRLTPPGERTPRATDCYRFSLSSPHVDACLCGPRDGRELDLALAALDEGPMSDDELAWMKKVGASVRTGANPRVFATRTA